jgi:hypothetical protein
MSYASFNSFDNYSPIEEIPQHAPAPPPPKQASPAPKQPPPEEPVYDFNKEFEKMQAAKAQYMLQAQAPIVVVPSPTPAPVDTQGYFDKLFSRKKDFLKLLQWVLIVLLAIAIHGFIKYYLYQYLSNGDFSFEREIVIRALYPLGILFVLWNLRVFAGKS